MHPRAPLALRTLLALGALLAACGPAVRTGEAQARLYHYTDNSGLDVTTTVAAAEHDLGPDVTVRGRYWGDYIVAGQGGLDPAAAGAVDGRHDHYPDPVFQSVGASDLRMAQAHDHGPGVDTVTAASTIVARGRELRKWRHEGLVGVDVRPRSPSAPLTLGVIGRGSHEPDFRSVSGVARGEVELFDQHTTIGGFIGHARDAVAPLEVPPGQEQEWPAGHQRWFGGVSVAQVLSKNGLASLGAMTILQQGRLANPYRRALVRTTQFSEVVPERRQRHLLFGQLSWHLGWDAAVHARNSLYFDSWGVRALIPEVALLKDIDGWLLLSLSYRYYTQARADFYAPRYQDLAPFLSGDPRLGRLTDHTARADVTWTLFGTPDVAGAVSLLTSYAISWMDYHDLVGPPIVAHMPSVGVSLVY